MDKHRVNIFIALVLVLIIIAAASMWLTSRDIKNTVPTESAEPTPALTPSVIPTPTPAPTESAEPSAAPSASPNASDAPTQSAAPQPTQSAAPQPTQGINNRTINQTGSFESNTGTKMIMYANWTATSQNSETVTIKLDVVLSTYTLSVGPHNGVITIAGVDYNFTSPGISYKSEMVRNSAVLVSRSVEVTVPAGQTTAIPVSVKWDFYGTYGGVEISQVTAGGTINING